MWIRIKIDTDGVDHRQHNPEDVLDAVLLDVSEKLGTLAFRQLAYPDLSSSHPYARTRLSRTTGCTGFVEVIGCPWVPTKNTYNPSEKSFPIPVLNKLVTKVREWEQKAKDLREAMQKESEAKELDLTQEQITWRVATEDTLRRVTREVRAILFSSE